MSHSPPAGAVLYAKDADRVAAFYVAAVGFRPVDRDDEHVRLETPAFQLVVLRIPEETAATIAIADPPVRRADAAIKLVFVVPSLDAVRADAAEWGGEFNAVEQEWTFNGQRVCDGLDPEGNVFQCRESMSR